MAYAHDNYVQSRHIKNNADLVNDVDEDLSDGALKAENTGDNTYHLTNKFGSVDVTVEDDDVKVTGDGSTYTAKSELKSTFGSYANQIKKMTKTITKGDSTDSNESSSSSKTSNTKNNASSKAELSNDELVVAMYLDGFGGATPQAKLKLANQILAKDNLPAKQIPTDDYLSGLYENNGYVGIASWLSTSHYADFKFSDDSDTVIKRMGGGGIIQTKKMSKSKVLKTWTPYKNELDQILSAVENNKKRIGKINEERAK
ncbi:MAG: hypothetical protein ACI4T3_06365 [Lactobacillus sp.]